MKEVTMNRHIDVKFFGAFDNCHMGCESCDFITSTHTGSRTGTAEHQRCAGHQRTFESIGNDDIPF